MSNPHDQFWMQAAIDEAKRADPEAVAKVAELREAARLMREHHGPEHVRHAYWSAVADWLDVKAANLAGPGPRDHDYGYALAVARAYLDAGPAGSRTAGEKQ